MKTVGDPASLKKAVVRHYHSEERELKKEANERIKKIRDWRGARISKIKNSRKARMQSIRETAKRRAINEARLAAQLEYQGKKEETVNLIVDEARKGLKKLSLSKEYFNYVKDRLPSGEYTAYCSDAKYKELFGKNMKIEKGIIGVKIVTGETTYDFTLDSLMDSRMSEVKMAASRTLFGD